MTLQTLISFFDSPKIDVPVVHLKGPFLYEDYAAKHLAKYREIMAKVGKCNLTIARDLLIDCPDTELSCRDNSRIKVGITNHIHNLEICYHHSADYRVLAIDRFILLNPEDSLMVERCIKLRPPTGMEIKSIHT